MICVIHMWSHNPSYPCKKQMQQLHTNCIFLLKITWEQHMFSMDVTFFQISAFLVCFFLNLISDFCGIIKKLHCCVPKKQRISSSNLLFCLKSYYLYICIIYIISPLLMYISLLYDVVHMKLLFVKQEGEKMNKKIKNPYLSFGIYDL